MTDTRTPIPDRPEVAHYEIRLAGHLDPRWTFWFDGLTVSSQADGTTLVSGTVADQAALHGVLQRVRDLGLPLVSVMRVEGERSDRPTPKPAGAGPRRRSTS
jgi:hypothetical protein